jgi:hypothetical protein
MEQLILGHTYDEYLVLEKKPRMTHGQSVVTARGAYPVARRLVVARTMRRGMASSVSMWAERRLYWAMLERMGLVERRCR